MKPTWPDCRPRRSPARARAPSAKGLEGWRFTLQAPDYFAVMTYLDDGAIRRKVYEAFAVRGATRRSRQPPAARAHSSNCGARRRRLLGFANFADLVLEDRMAHTGDRALAFLEDLKSKTERRFHAGEPGAVRIPPQPGRPGRARARPVGRRLLRREAAHRALRFRRGGAAPLLPDGARGRRPLRTRAPPLRHPRGRGIRRAGVGRRRALLQCPRRGRRLSGRLLCRLVSPREQARRRLDGRPDHRRSRRPMASARTWD